eukprot:m.359867 g.359867  ORF g.359867 m.359867 type:complete len:764 (-) comp18782_c0_seq1:82-2373(-)
MAQLAALLWTVTVVAAVVVPLCQATAPVNDESLSSFQQNNVTAGNFSLRVCFFQQKAVVIPNLTVKANSTVVFDSLATSSGTCSDYSAQVYHPGDCTFTATEKGKTTPAYTTEFTVSPTDARVTLWIFGTASTDATVSVADAIATQVRRVNVANVRVMTLDSAAYVWHRSTNCYRCNNSLLNLASSKTPSAYTEVQANFEEELSFSTCNRMTSQCAVSPNVTYLFGEAGYYTVVLHLESAGSVKLDVVRDVDGFVLHGIDRMPVLYAALILLGLFAISQVLIKCMYKKRDKVFEMSLNSSGSEAAPLFPQADNAAGPSRMHAIGNPKTSKKRLHSLDSFRGFALTIMIFVNYGGGGYFFFDHSIWNGLTVADLVFPWFIWIMGTSMAIAFNSLLSKSTSRLTMLWKVARRSSILFIVGILIIGNLHDLYTGRIPGVLQRFAISYLGVGLIILFMPKLPHLFVAPDSKSDLKIPALAQGYSKRKARTDLESINNQSYARFSDILPYLWEWVVVAVVGLSHVFISLYVTAPGCPQGYLGPGGELAEFGRFMPTDGSTCTGETFCCEGGIAGYLDRWVLSWHHIYRHPTSEDTYKTGYYDPEGILGSLTSILMCYFGLQAGRIIIHYDSHTSRTIRWLLWSVFCGVIAAGLSGCSKNEGVIPISKNLWSFTFITVMSCFGFFLFTVFYWVIDVWKLWDGAPFRYVGMNSIFIYVFHETFNPNFPFSWVYRYGDVTHGRLMFQHVVAVSILVLICYYCYKIDFFVKV